MIVFGEYVCEWTAKRSGGTYYAGSGQGIGIEKDGVLIGGVLFDCFNGQSVQMHVASDGSSRWITKKLLAMCFDYAFNQLKVKKILGLPDSTNHKALSFDLSLGFVQEAVIKDAGRCGDMVVLTMTRDQCRFLDERYAKNLKE